MSRVYGDFLLFDHIILRFTVYIKNKRFGHERREGNAGKRIHE